MYFFKKPWWPARAAGSGSWGSVGNRLRSGAACRGGHGADARHWGGSGPIWGCGAAPAAGSGPAWRVEAGRWSQWPGLAWDRRLGLKQWCRVEVGRCGAESVARSGVGGSSAQGRWRSTVSGGGARGRVSRGGEIFLNRVVHLVHVERD
jgi:hypothetical protein